MIMDRQPCFQFKANFSPCTVLQLLRYDLDALEPQLNASIAQAPNFFMGSALVIDLEKVQALGVFDFSKIKHILITAGLVPVGVKGGSPEQMQAAIAAGLPVLTLNKSPLTETKKPAEERTTKLVAMPIRSGMQVYAKDSDLIVVAQVSPGAELLADGHIHVYGALRGRAMAGVQGNTQARIFCRTLEAELVSIAGYYLTKEDIQTLPSHDGMIQIYLENEQVRIEAV